MSQVHDDQPCPRCKPVRALEDRIADLERQLAVSKEHHECCAEDGEAVRSKLLRIIKSLDLDAVPNDDYTALDLADLLERQLAEARGAGLRELREIVTRHYKVGSLTMGTIVNEIDRLLAKKQP